MNQYSKNCPNCKEVIFYKNISILNSSIERNAKCRKCTFKDRGSYSKEEENFLIENYAKYGGLFCSKHLNRSKGSIRVKAIKLNLKYKQPIKPDNKICGTCRNELEKTNFGLDNNRKDKLHPCCKNCVNIKNQKIENKQRKSQYDKKYVRHKLNTDTNFKLKRQIRKSFLRVLKNKKIIKNTSILKVLGCNIQEFKKHIESQFTKGMNWNNHAANGWHIDHIIPCASFNLEKEEDLKKCWHYTNLRPLWATTEIAMRHGETKEYIGNLNKHKNLV